MRTMFLIAHILILLSAATPVVAQLPPEILADSYMLEVEQAFRDGDHARAQAKIREILRLQTDHALTLNDLDFWQAKAADSMGSPEQALEFVLRYLTIAGRESRHYLEALKLMNKVQAVVSCKGWETVGYFKEATNQAVSACLGTGIDLETRYDLGRTALHRAAAHTKDSAVIEALLKAGADLEALDANAHSPLVLAVVENENPRLIATLLRAGANPQNMELILEAPATDPTKLERVLEPVVSHISDRGTEVRYRAEMLEFMVKVQALARCKGWETEEYFKTATLDEVTACLDTGIDLEARDGSGRMPLHRAIAQTDDPSVLGALLGAGADPRALDGDGLTPVHYATSRTTSLGVIEALLTAGADPMARQEREEIGKLEAGEEHAYSFFGRAAQEQILYAEAHEYTPQITVTSPSGKRFYGNSIQREKETLLLSLEETGEYRIRIYRGVLGTAANTADSKTYKLRITHRTPLEMAVTNFENPAVLKAMFEAGADPNVENDFGQTPLHQAARHNENQGVIQVLLSNTGSLRKKDIFGRTPVHYAALNENPAVTQVLLTNAGRPMDKDVFGRTSMHYAAKNKNINVINILMKAGGDPKTKDKDKWRPLHYAAAFNENPAMIRTLLNAGAKLEEKADDGYRALHLAAMNNENPAVTQTLVDAGAKIRPSAGYLRNTPLRMRP